MTTLDPQEREFLNLINEYRRQNGLGPLQVSRSLTEASRWLSRDMANNNYFSHTDRLGRNPFQRMSDFGYNFNTFRGENIAAGNADARATFEQWRNSPGHNANMLNPNFRVIGIGRANNNNNRFRWLWTTKFGGLAQPNDIIAVNPNQAVLASFIGPVDTTLITTRWISSFVLLLIIIVLILAFIYNGQYKGLYGKY